VRRTVVVALLVLTLCAGALALPASGAVDLGATMTIDTDKPLKGSNITVTVTVSDVGGLVDNETANGTLAVRTSTMLLGELDIDFDNTTGSVTHTFYWVPTEEGSDTLTATLTIAGDTAGGNDVATTTYEVESPSGLEAGETSSVATIVGVLALVLFFGVIIASVLGWIPQDRLPVQPALILATFIIMGLAFIGGTYDDNVEAFGLSSLASKIIIHPITALIAGFLVAGALEAAGAFEAAADGLQRLEAFKTKGGQPIFGIVGTVVLLTNLPTIIAMPCGRILAAALMPAALFFGVRVARAFQNPTLVSVVVFSFIVNAAASCGPSLIGGIGTIGEGLARLETGSLSDAQQLGIILATGVCALVMRFVTVSVPPDLAEEEEERLEQERRANSAGGMQP
jgi:hypothetical protein